MHFQTSLETPGVRNITPICTIHSQNTDFVSCTKGWGGGRLRGTEEGYDLILFPPSFTFLFPPRLPLLKSVVLGYAWQHRMAASLSAVQYSFILTAICRLHCRAMCIIISTCLGRSGRDLIQEAQIFLFLFSVQFPLVFTNQLICHQKGEGSQSSL